MFKIWEGRIQYFLKLVLFAILILSGLLKAESINNKYDKRVIELINKSSIDEYLKSLQNTKDYSFINLKYRKVIDKRDCDRRIGISFKSTNIENPLIIQSEVPVVEFIRDLLNDKIKNENNGKHFNSNDTIYIDVEINKLLVTEATFISTEMECYFEIYDKENNKLHQQLISVADTIESIEENSDRFTTAISNIIVKFNHDLLMIENLYNKIINIERYSKYKKDYEKTNHFRKNISKEMFAMGISAGVGFVDVYGAYVDNLKKNSMLAGSNEFRFTGNFDICFYWYFHKNIAMQTGIFNFNKGTKILLDQESGGYSESWTKTVNVEMKLYKQYHVSFFELPLLLNFKIPSPNNKNAFNFTIGPSFGIVTSSKLKYYVETTEQSNDKIMNTVSKTNSKELLEEINIMEDQMYEDSLGNEFTDKYDDYYNRGDISLLVSVAYERRLKRVGVFLRFLYLHGFISYLDLQQQALLNMVNYNSDIQHDSVIVNEELPEMKFKTLNLKFGFNVYF